MMITTKVNSLSRSRHFTVFLLATAMSLFMSACNDTSENAMQGNADDAAISTQGLALTWQAPPWALEDVTAIRYELHKHGCFPEDVLVTYEHIVETVPLSEFTIPGGINSLENNPLDADSTHQFADLFISLEPACYDIVLFPVGADGETAYIQCNVPSINNVQVLPGETTEVLAIMQCNNEDSGALDVIVALNQEPHIENLWFEESKFIGCGEPQVVCASAIDQGYVNKDIVENDPLEFEWTVGASTPSYTSVQVISTETDPATGVTTQCVQFTPVAIGRYDVTLRVYDLLHDADGNLMRIEDWTAQQYQNKMDSHATLDFFFYAMGDENAVTSTSTGTTLIATQDTMLTVTITQAYSAYRNVIYLYSAEGEAIYIGEDQETGKVVGPIRAGEEAVFGLMSDNGQTVEWFRTGPGIRNPESSTKAHITQLGPNSFQVAFDDSFGDNSFDDAVIRVDGALRIEELTVETCL
jgi:hypothetical protein